MSGWFKLATHFPMNRGELIIALVGIALQLGLWVLLLVQRSYRQFPIFHAYVGFSVVSAGLSIAVRHHSSLLFYIYWVSEGFYVLLTFFALQETFRSVFRNFYRFPWVRLSFPVIAIVMVGVAISRVVFLPPAEHNPLTSALISLEIAVGFLQFGIFCIFILLVSFFHMRWRLHAFGIVLGFGIAAAGSLVAFLLRSEFGKNLDHMLRIASPLSYIMGVAIWVATFCRPEPSYSNQGWTLPLPLDLTIAELQQYTKAVKGIVRR